MKIINFSYFLLFPALLLHCAAWGVNNASVSLKETNHLETVDNHQDNPISPCSFIPKPMDCSEVLKNGNTKNGVYRIYPRTRALKCDSFQVYCDMETDGTGWTVIQRRGKYDYPENYFFKNWSEYKKGFGDLEKEFWLGNDKIHALSNQGSYSIRFDVTHVNGTKAHDLYETFWIENEELKYRLNVDGYSGIGSDGMTYHNKMPFSTLDKDSSSGKCVATRTGGWWFNNCLLSNLNGLNKQGAYGGNYAIGIFWNTFTETRNSLAFSEIKIRARSAA